MWVAGCWGPSRGRASVVLLENPLISAPLNMSIVAPHGFLSLPDAVGIVARRQAAEDEQPGRARRRIAAADLRRGILEGKIGLFALFTDRVRLTDRDLLTVGLMPEKTDTVVTFAYLDRVSGALSVLAGSNSRS